MREKIAEKLNIWEVNKIAEFIKNGKIGIMPTETIPGLVCSALSRDGVEKMLFLKDRPDRKPPTIIISDFGQLKELRVNISRYEKDVLEKIWPASISFVLSCAVSSKKYLHRGLLSLAIRLPKNKQLRQLIDLTGPLATTSANFSGQPSAKTVLSSAKTFSGKIDFYVVGGRRGKDIPSTIAKINSKTGKIEIIRLGADENKLTKLNIGFSENKNKITEK